MVPMKSGKDAKEKIYAVIERIPPGKVATYGQVAALAGLPRQARRVGHALKVQPEGSSLPWHRVINAQGGISDRGMGWEAGYQRHLLEEEGVVFDARGRVDLDRFRWDPVRSPRSRPRRPRAPRAEASRRP
jgi:methylated-DNA-protein-cysteine methyltransferase-like protein